MNVSNYLVQFPNPLKMCGISRSSQSQALSSTPLPLILQSSIQQWLRVNSCQEPGKEPWARHSPALAEFSVQQECREPAYCILSAALSQHNLSGSGIAQLEFYHCQEPAWGTPPMAKVMRKEAWHTQRRDQASGAPLEILEHLPPKPESAYFLLCALTYTSDFTGGCPPLPLSEKGVNLELQLIINSWAWQEYFNLQTPLKVL